MNFEEQVLGLLGQINGRLDRLETDVSDLKTTQAEQGKALVELKEDVSELRTDVTTLKEDVGEIRETATRVAIMQENTVIPRIGTLAEGHTHLSKTLASKEQLDKMGEFIVDKVVVLESVVKSHSARIAKLEKAQ